jgi:fibrillarin-like pre-rRNA processing protein
MEIVELFPGVFQIKMDDNLFLVTLNLTPGRSVYGERIISAEDDEFRSWNPYRSKLAAPILKGIEHMPISAGSKVLYLGAASGTTCSHISDIIGDKGHVWAVDFAPRPLRDLVDNVARYRRNISPMMADARRPDSYPALIPTVDVIYADVAQPDQYQILARNADLYLRAEGWAMMAIKARSIDVTRSPREVYREQVEGLDDYGFDILGMVELEPYEKDHAMVIIRHSA